MIRTLTLHRPISEAESLKSLGRAPEKALKDTFSLVTWNMSKARRRTFFADVADIVSSSDIVVLQEAVLHGDRAHAFHEESGLEWIMGQSFRHRNKAITTGVKTGARVASTWQATIRSVDREPVVRSHKSALATCYRLLGDDQPLMVLNVHAINFVGARKYKRQMEQLTGLISAHRGPLIVAGDFNSWSPRRRVILAQAARELGLTRVPVAARRLRHFNQILDHIFYRGLHVVSAKALLHIKSSDHVPLWVMFKSG